MTVECDERERSEIERAFEAFTDDVRESTEYPFTTDLLEVNAAGYPRGVRSTVRSADDYADETGETYQEVDA